MTRKIGIIGLGHVGATLAHSMILKHTCDHLVLIDTNEKKVKADALDFCDAVANTGYPVHITRYLHHLLASKRKLRKTVICVISLQLDISKSRHHDIRIF